MRQMNDKKSLVSKHLPECAHLGPDLGTQKVWQKRIVTASLCYNCGNLGETNSPQALHGQSFVFK